MADFSCVAVPMLVAAEEDGRKLAYLFFSELYKLFLVFLLFTLFFLEHHKPYLNWPIACDVCYTWSL